ncbi:PLP-dependent transferase [Athelia psychrophila]|uniref:PLP-dependent transferase n=1 Tax=Athelia psychrophila TaxID=1759441 RepID=A0A166H197_9AGAM|nr:PLP-dependent transferase [Fibularhizoctonia sp. CBS 109695]
MGNAHSSPTSSGQHDKSRKRSAGNSRLAKSCCTSGDQFHSAGSVASEDTYCDEKHIAEPPKAKCPSYLPESLSNDNAVAYKAFLKAYPEYKLTETLDTLRQSDFTRLDRTGETYVDYMGGSVYPESLVRQHTSFLNNSVMGNTHSVSNSSRISTTCANDARAAILSFFDAPPEYTVVFTANATGALKLVGESYPFVEHKSSYVLGADSHNSVHGIREYAARLGAHVRYIDSTENGGLVEMTAKAVLSHNRPEAGSHVPCLFALTGQSNISNSKNPLSMAKFASSLGYHVLLDAAALAPTSTISLSEYPEVDAMAISFYKMFGFPTGVGALVVKKSFLAMLRRPWFAGGNVDVVQVPGTLVTRSSEIHEQFEDGTINYLTLSSITSGLHFLSAYMPFLPLRLSSLMIFLTSSLSRMRYEGSDSPVVRILSRIPSRRLRSVGEQSDTGSVMSFIFLSPDGTMMPNSFIEHAATAQKISLRTGCMCNPGGAAALLGVQDDMQHLYPGVTLRDFEQIVGRELGVIRVSLGLASSFDDVWKIIRFTATIANHKSRKVLWDRWTAEHKVGHAF